MKKIILALVTIGVLSLPVYAQTKSSATLTQIVTPAPAVAASITFKSSGTLTGINTYSSVLGTTITYSGTVTCSGSTAAGTMTVVGLTGTQTVTVGTNGAFTCSETPTAVTPVAGTSITATFNSSSPTICY